MKYDNPVAKQQSSDGIFYESVGINAIEIEKLHEHVGEFLRGGGSK